jgi:hypothetical protein
MGFTDSWWVSRLAVGAVAAAAIAAALAPAAAYAATGQTITVTGVADKVVVDALGPNAPDTVITQLHVAGRAIPAPAGSTVADGASVAVTLRTTQPMTDTAAVTAASRGDGSAVVQAVSQTGTAPAGTAAASVAGTSPAGFASGQHTLRLVPVYWSTPDSATQSSLQALADQTTQYWNSQANGRFSVTTTTVPNWIQIPNPGACNMTTVLNSTLAAGIADVTGPTDHLLMYFPRRSDCPWAGLGSVGGSYIWDNGYVMTDVTSHEFGHNIGLGHANKDKCTSAGLAVPLSTTCTVQEYGDWSDVMGIALGRAPGNLSGAFADYLGLSNTVVATPGQVTDVDLAPLGSGPAPTVRIDAPTGPVFVDFRPFAGVDTRDSTLAGVQVRQLVMAGAPTTRLLNMQPSPTNTTWGAPLMGVWQVPGAGLAIQVTSIGGVAHIRAVPTAGDTVAPTNPGFVAPSATNGLIWTPSVDTGTGVAVYTVTLDGKVVGRVDPSTTTFALPALTTGTTHSVVVNASDAAGNSSRATAVSFVAAATGPVAPGPDAATLTAPATGTAVPASFPVTWSLPASPTAPVASIQVLLDGKVLTTVPVTGGATTGTTTVRTIEKAHSIVLRSIGGTGQVLDTSTAAVVAVDASVPTFATTPALALAIGADPGTDPGTLTWPAATDRVSGVAGYTVKLDGTEVAQAAGTATSAQVPTPTGSHVYVVTALDAVGNKAMLTKTFFVDVTRPSTPQITAPVAGWITSSAPLLKWTAATDAETGIGSYAIVVDQGTPHTVAGTALSSAVSMSQGAHHIDLYAVNKAGLAGDPTSVDVTVDSIAPTTPTVPTMTPDPNSVVGGAPTSGTLSWTGSTEAGSGLATYVVSVDGHEVTRTASTSAQVTIALGKHTWSVSALDNAGLTSRPVTLLYAVDPTAPNAPVFNPIAAWVASKSPVLTWKPATDLDTGIGSYRLTVNGTTTTLAGTAASAVVKLTDGANQVSLVAVNVGGTEAAPVTVTVNVDSTAPTAPVITAPAAGHPGGTLSVTWNAATDDRSGIASYRVLLSGRVVATVDGSTTTASVTTGLTAGTIAVQAVNGAGLVTGSTTVSYTAH